MHFISLPRFIDGSRHDLYLYNLLSLKYHICCGELRKTRSVDMSPIVLFDGECNLCNRSVQFIIKRDPAGYFRFASLQSEIGRQLLRQYGLPSDCNSFILIEDEQCYLRSTAALRVCRNLKGLWKILSIFLIIPRFLRDPIYNIIAKNRTRWFGTSNSCLMPSSGLEGRFLK